MNKLVLVAAAVALLALGTVGCSSKPAAPAAPPAPATANRAPAGKSGLSAPGITAAELADYQKVAACMKQQGVTVAEPAVGEPFDDSEMNRLFDDDKAKWDAVLSNCDYARVVIGVG